MSERIYLKDWNYEGSDKVRLVYSDNDIVFVSRTDFNRAFGAIINADKNAIVRDFAIK